MLFWGCESVDDDLRTVDNVMGLLVVKMDDGGVVSDDEFGADDKVCASYLLLNEVKDGFLLIGW